MLPHWSTRSLAHAANEGPIWKNEFEAIAMPLIESYDVILCETASGCVFECYPSV